MTPRMMLDISLPYNRSVTYSNLNFASGFGFEWGSSFFNRVQYCVFGDQTRPPAVSMVHKVREKYDVTRPDDGRMFPLMKMYCEGRNKPVFRGFFHLFGLLTLVPLWVNDILPHLDSQHEQIAVFSLVLGSILCWGTSALFHTVPWTIEEEIRWQKLDHAAIFLKIAFIYTPFAYLTIGKAGDSYHDLALWISVVLTWLGAFAGVWHVHNIRADRIIYHGILIVGNFPCYFFISGHCTLAERAFAVIGLVLYPIGTAIFVKKYLNYLPHLLGYHEIFHIFTLVSGWMSYLLMFSMVAPLDVRCQLSADVFTLPGMETVHYLLTHSITTAEDICSA